MPCPVFPDLARRTIAAATSSVGIGVQAGEEDVARKKAGPPLRMVKINHMGDQLGGKEGHLPSHKDIDPFERVILKQLFDKVFPYGAGGAYDKCFHRR